MKSTHKLECLAIIPARGGSKGIPRKNVRHLAGKPLIAHIIEQAHLAQYISRVVVSTDDPEIAAVSESFGAEVVWRPAEISGDSAASELALLHTLDILKKSEGYQPELLAFLQCTSPLTLAEDIDGTILVMLEKQADSALAVVPFHYFLWRDNLDGAEGINHQKAFRPLRQEREPQYLEAGAVYTMRAPGFLSARHRFFGKTALYVMPAERRLEIDEPLDFEIAEVLLKQRKKKQRSQHLPAQVKALVLDFDGVFTDNRVYVSQNESEAVICDRSDGYGIGLVKRAGISVLVLSTEPNPVVQARANKLNIPCIQGLHDKWPALQLWLQEQGIRPEQVVYVGNDVNDLQCMQHVGCAVAVADAYPEILSQADLILEREGGKGAIREICDLILASRDRAKAGQENRVEKE